MIKFFLTMLIILVSCGTTEVIFKDSTGLVLEIKNEVGMTISDTGTVLSKIGSTYYVTKPDGVNVYEAGNVFSIRRMDRKK